MMYQWTFKVFTCSTHMHAGMSYSTACVCMHTHRHTTHSWTHARTHIHNFTYSHTLFNSMCVCVYTRAHLDGCAVFGNSAFFLILSLNYKCVWIRGYFFYNSAPFDRCFFFQINLIFCSLLFFFDYFLYIYISDHCTLPTKLPSMLFAVISFWVSIVH